MGYKILLNNKIGTSTYETKEKAEQVANYIKRVFEDLNVEVIKELENDWSN